MNSNSIDDAYRRYFPMIYAKCLRMLGTTGDAEDAAQESFARLWAHRDTLHDEPKLVGWVYRTATRLCLDVLRARRSRPQGDLPVDTKTPEATAGARELLGMLLEDLDARSLEVVALCRVDGLSQGEVATLLDVSDRTVRRILSNADVHLGRVQARLQ